MTLLEEIEAEFLDAEGWPRKTPLPRERVRGWLQSGDLEVLDAAHRLLHHKDGFGRVEPPFTEREEVDFLKGFYERSLNRTRDQEGDDELNVMNGWELTHAIVYWIYEVFVSPQTAPALRDELRDWLAHLLKTSLNRELLSTAVIDHLLHVKKTRRFFQSWREDDKLKVLFEEN